VRIRAALPKEWNPFLLIQKITPRNRFSLSDFFAQNNALHCARKWDLHFIPKSPKNTLLLTPY